MEVIYAHLKISRHEWARIAFYVLCLLPISIDGYGVNYLFALAPLMVLLLGKRLERPPSNIIFFIYACLAAFLISSAYQYQWIKYFDRRLISFFLFISMFSMCFVKITKKHITSFKVAVVICSALVSCIHILKFLSLGEAAQGFESKDIVGSQRFGFVYILGFWILWYEKTLRFGKTVRLLILLILLMGVILTFSRASILSFGSSCLFAIASTITNSLEMFVRFVRRIIIGTVFFLLGFLSVNFLAPIIFDFINARLFTYFQTDALLNSLVDPETSEGTRLFIWKQISAYLLHNPLTGAGFLGVWVLNLFGDFSGSSHNQYFDALFRLGPILFVWYLYFLFKILKFYARADIGLFIGITGLLVYGLFHETFKESHGSFIFAMLLAGSMRPKCTRQFQKIEKPI